VNTPPTQYVLCITRLSAHPDAPFIMLRKTRPDWQAGLLNFPGGKLEPTDLRPERTCSREYEEECGLRLEPSRWRRVGALESTGWQVQVFAATLERGETVHTTTDETVVLVSPERLFLTETAVVPNARWLASLSQDPDQPRVHAFY
jgi:8-oxo-dGTP pyrophosphatase MutT (NUDIX family)